jgi:hypothetical protein
MLSVMFLLSLLMLSSLLLPMFLLDWRPVPAVAVVCNVALPLFLTSLLLLTSLLRQLPCNVLSVTILLSLLLL